jgi:hypothetical protein
VGVGGKRDFFVERERERLIYLPIDEIWRYERKLGVQCKYCRNLTFSYHKSRFFLFNIAVTVLVFEYTVLKS